MRICPKNEKYHYNWLEVLHGCHLITVILEYSDHLARRRLTYSGIGYSWLPYYPHLSSLGYYYYYYYSSSRGIRHLYVPFTLL